MNRAPISRKYTRGAIKKSISQAEKPIAWIWNHCAIYKARLR